jgi:hypothetical protein
LLIKTHLAGIFEGVPQSCGHDYAYEKHRNDLKSKKHKRLRFVRENSTGR